MSGMFRYVNPDSRSIRTFIWDDAGIDRNGSLVLVEEETGGLVPLHVEGHIARIKVMIAKGENLAKIVWIVKERDFERMNDLLRFYAANLGPIPEMEIWSDSGFRLASVP